MSSANLADGVMVQHFLLSSAARTLSLVSVARMDDEEADQRFVQIRWGAPQALDNDAVQS
jgi:hypothetical protein